MEDKPEPSRSTSGGRPDAQSEVASDLTPSEEEGGGGSIGWYGLIFAGRAGSGIRCSANGLRQAGGTEDCRSFCQFGSIGWSATAACTFSAYGVIALLLPCVLPYHCRQLPRLAARCRPSAVYSRLPAASASSPNRSRSKQRAAGRGSADALGRSRLLGNARRWSLHICAPGVRCQGRASREVRPGRWPRPTRIGRTAQPFEDGPRADGGPHAWVAAWG